MGGIRIRIEVYGAGCSTCEGLALTVRKVVSAMKVKAEVVHVSDMGKILSSGIMMTPALFIDGKKKCEGRAPSVEEIKRWISEARA